MDLGRDFGLTIARKLNREWTQEYIPVEEIEQGVVIVKDPKGRKHYVKILEIVPMNFALKSPSEQDTAITKYMSWLKVGPSNFQIKMITKRTSVDEYIEASREAALTEESPKCREAINNYILFLQRQGSIQTIERHYYLIYEFEAEKYGKKAKSEEDVIATLNHQAEIIKTEFHNIGNEVFIRDGSSGENPDKEIATFLYNYYNPRTSFTESFTSRVNRIINDTRIVNNLTEDEDPVVNIKDIISPKSLDFEESPEYMVIDGVYKTFYFVASEGYPPYMSTLGGWLNSLMHLGEGVDVDVFFLKGDATQKLISIQNHLKFAGFRMRNTQQEQLDADEVASKYDGLMMMKSALKAGGEDVYDMVVIITLTAYAREDLYAMKESMEKIAVQLDLKMGECKRYQEEAFISTSPFLQVTPKLFNLSHRNLTTSGVAAGYPYTSFALSDKTGVAMGFNTRNQSLVMFDPFDAEKYPNANMTIFGRTGNGKTYALLTLATRIRCQGTQCFILAPEKQDEFRRVVDAVGGIFIDVSPASQQRINLFDVRPMTSPAKELLGGEDYTDKSWVMDKVDNLKIWLKYLIPDLTIAEASQLETVLVNMYQDFGYTADNNSVYADSSRAELKKPPIMQDFYERVLKEEGLRKDIPIILSQFITGSASNMNGYTNVDLDNKFIVFGMENLKGDIQAPMMFMFLEYVWAKTREDRTKKKMIFIDEGWKLISGQNQQVADFVIEIFKLIRGFGGGAIFATQNVQDLFQSTGNVGATILSCAISNIILGMQQTDIENINSVLRLSQAEIDSIASAQRGEALFCAGANHIPIKIKASQYEHALFTTKRSDLETLVNEGLAQQNSGS